MRRLFELGVRAVVLILVDWLSLPRRPKWKKCASKNVLVFAPCEAAPKGFTEKTPCHRPVAVEGNDPCIRFFDSVKGCLDLGRWASFWLQR